MIGLQSGSKQYVKSNTGEWIEDSGGYVISMSQFLTLNRSDRESVLSGSDEEALSSSKSEKEKEGGLRKLTR